MCILLFYADNACLNDVTYQVRAYDLNLTMKMTPRENVCPWKGVFSVI